ncbi:SurA N-terminal domain-containing protein [Patescibacteria group bacterium]|nr:SurA N-terminal domain-containing protein [Patescibacteria group bacterium]
MENENVDNKKNIISTLVVLVLVILAIGSYFVFGKNKTDGPVNNDVASVAIVNGTVISRATYDTQLANNLASYKAQGIDVTDETKLSQIKTQVLDNLIGDELLNQGVMAAGIKITAEEVEKQFQVILTQEGGADGLQAALVQNNLSEEQLRENISKQLAVQKYLLQNIDTKSITVSDIEVAQFYANLVQSQAGGDATTPIPDLNEISDQIKQQIISEKQQTLVVDFIASLRAKATVTTNI